MEIVEKYNIDLTTVPVPHWREVGDKIEGLSARVPRPRPPPPAPPIGERGEEWGTATGDTPRAVCPPLINEVGDRGQEVGDSHDDSAVL